MRIGPIRITGLNSGLDTDSMVKALSASYQTKIDKIYKQNESVKYKKETWEELNSKMYSFYTGALSDAKYKKPYSTSDITSIKNFINGYNDVVEEMSAKYNTKSEGYEPLTEEEKDALSDREVEKWEDKIKDSSLYRDSCLANLRFKFTQTMVEGVEMNDGTKMYLSDFGITKGNYFNTPANERDSYKIDEEKLQKMIDENPNKVEEFFSKLSSKLYDTTTKEMSSTSSSSLYKVYNDKQFTKQQQTYEKEMLKIEEQMFKAEERYYKQFAQMEEMLASINSQTNMFASLLEM